MLRIPDYDACIIFKNVAMVESAHQHCSLGLQYEDLVLDTTFYKPLSEGSRRQYGRSTHWYIPSTVFLELGPLSTAQTGCRKATSGVINCSIALLCRSGEDVEVSNRTTPRISSPGFSMNALPLTGQNVSTSRLELQNSCQAPGLCSTKQRAQYCRTRCTDDVRRGYYRLLLYFRRWTNDKAIPGSLNLGVNWTGFLSRFFSVANFFRVQDIRSTRTLPHNLKSLHKPVFLMTLMGQRYLHRLSTLIFEINDQKR